MRLTKLALCLAIASTPALAELTTDTVITTDLDAIQVTATRTEKSVLNSAQAINVISNEEIERQQAASVFDVLDTVPNVSASGGPSTSGHKFNIRGFSDAEDVLVTIDGAIQTFEKYRMGSFFSDADLYKSINIKRGPSTVLHGGGALGGVVQLELKDAADFLQPDQTVGAKVKLSHHSNNSQKNGSVYAYARPTESIDLLAAYIKRDGDDFELSNGEKLDNSAVKTESLLLKGEYYINDESLVSLAYSDSEDSQRTEFNTTDAGPWGTVYRTVEQQTINAAYELMPNNNDYLNLKASLGYSQSHVTESDGSAFLKDFIGVKSQYEYNILTLDIANTSKLGKHVLTYGVQYTDKDRVGEKTAYPCEQIDYQTYECLKYSDTMKTEEMTSQPSGTQKRTGVYIQDDFTWQNLNIVAGLRYERYSTSGTASFNAKFAALDTELSHSDVVPAVTVNYALTDAFAVFANYQKGFRAPLIDELYDQYGGRNPGLTLDIEKSTNTEFGVTYQTNNLFAEVDTLAVRALYFDIAVDDEIRSVTSKTANPLPNARYSNSGSNDRYGIEMELNYANKIGYANLSYSTLTGRNQDAEPLWYLPADKIALNAGLSWFDDQVRTGLIITRNKDRFVQAYNPATRIYEQQTHKGYNLTNLYVSWDITPALNLNLAVDNLFDNEYKLVAGTGGAIGNYGIGRNIKTQLSFTF